jgi:hypothetical protein
MLGGLQRAGAHHVALLVLGSNLRRPLDQAEIGGPPQRCPQVGAAAGHGLDGQLLVARLSQERGHPLGRHVR